MSENQEFPSSFFRRTGGISPDEGAVGAASMRGVWKFLTSQPGLSVMLVRTGGYVEYANEALAKECMSLRVDEIVGRLVSDLLVESVAAEILSAINRVKGTHKQLIRRVVFQGREMQVTYRWLANDWGEGGRALISLQRGYREPQMGANVEVERAGFIDLGPLAVLTIRELEVLAYVGQGLRVKEIAAKLSRSPKTVSSHLCSIYNKTKTTDRAVLMGIACEAGLTPEMIALPRVVALKAKKSEGGGGGTVVA